MSINSEDILNMFFSYDILRTNRIKNDNIIFAHYTNASTARRILSSEELWLRNVSDMNDFSEIELGQYLLLKILKSPSIINEFNSVFREISISTFSFNDIISHIENNFSDMKKFLYIACLSEHQDEDNAYGRLSMWRAYAPQNGVALIINPNFLSDAPALNGIFFMTSPVRYSSHSQIRYLEDDIHALIVQLRAISFSHSPPQEHEESALFFIFLNKFYSTIASIKHIGFQEEKEWRIILSTQGEISPSLSEHKDILKKQVVDIRGIPQQIYKINLPRLYNISQEESMIPHLLNKIIIGPSHNPELIKEVFCDILREKNIDLSTDKIVISDIPLRI